MQNIVKGAVRQSAVPFSVVHELTVSSVCWQCMRHGASMSLPTQLSVMPAVWGISFAAFLLGLPLLKGPVAFAATTSIACAGLVLSYAMPILLRLVFARRMEEVGPFSLGRSAIHAPDWPLLQLRKVKHILQQHLHDLCCRLGACCILLTWVLAVSQHAVASTGHRGQQSCQ